MNIESKRTMIAGARRIVLAGLVVLIAWLGLFALRGAISPNMINLMNQEMKMESSSPTPLALDSRAWDWSRSLWSGRSVSSIVGERLGGTLVVIAATMLISLSLSLLILFVGARIVRATNRPTWLGRSRSVLRFVLISVAVSVPIFAWQTLAVVYPGVWWGIPANSQFTFWIATLAVSVIPVWLLVQYGQRELANVPIGRAIWKHLSVGLAIRTLRLVGAIIVVSMLFGLSAPFNNLGRLFVDAINRRDFPVIFGIAWALAAIVVLVRLAADLIEIGYNSRRQPDRDDRTSTPLSRPPVMPRWLPVVCLALVAVSLGVAAAAPVIATHGYNDMALNARLQPPSPQYILGTDNLGRDVFSRLIFGIRQDVFLGLLAAGIMLAFAVGWAIVGSRASRSDDWRGDTLEDLVMLPRDVLYAFPWLVLLLLATSLAGIPASGPVAFLRYLLPVTLAVSLVILPRAVAMIQEAYRSAPAGTSRLYALLMSVPIILLFAVAGSMLFLAAVGYMGFGVAPPAPELGGMLTGPARRYMLQAPWMALWPPLVLVLLLAAWVMAGEALLERFGFRSKAVWSKIWE